MKILIREGSAAKNFEALIDLMHEHFEMMMFCSDDKHPDSLAEGHINQLCKRAVAKGIDVFKILQAACINPVEHYKMNIGLLKVGDAADFIVVECRRLSLSCRILRCPAVPHRAFVARQPRFYHRRHGGQPYVLEIRLAAYALG